MSSIANSQEGCRLFNESKNLHSAISLSTNNFYLSSKKEETFNLIVKRIEDLYSPTVKSLGADLTINKLWNDPTRNANAEKLDKKWVVNVYGGMFRHKDMTEDGFALVVCHEVGHLLGGAPFLNNQVFDLSVEGQADYWGSAICLKKYFNEFPEDNIHLKPSIAKTKCDSEFVNDEHEKNNCYRGVLAGFSLATFLAHNDGTKEIDTNESASGIKLKYTYQDHPEAQCRMDTYLAGTLCTVPDTTDAFEEKLLQDKLVTDLLCQNDQTGQFEDKRPTCWYNSKINYLVEDKSKPIVGFSGGKVDLIFSSHLAGTYKIKLTPSKSTDYYVKLANREITKELTTAAKAVEVVFDYTLTQWTSRELKFDLTIENEKKIIYHEVIVVRIKVKG
jgi:hypothetical protein